MPEYKKKYKGSGSEYSRDPALSDDGSVLIFMSIGYKPDGSAEGWQFYQYSADGNHRQITHLNEIQNAAVSPRGELLAVIHESTKNINNIVIYQSKDGTGREITLPDQPSRIINSQ
jgi:Tol biopolymer transport system component